MRILLCHCVGSVHLIGINDIDHVSISAHGIERSCFSSRNSRGDKVDSTGSNRAAESQDPGKPICADFTTAPCSSLRRHLRSGLYQRTELRSDRLLESTSREII